MNNWEFQKAAQLKLVECWDKLERHFGRTVPAPTLTFDLKLTSKAAGIAHYRSGKTFIQLNMGYVVLNAKEMLERTTPHEVVHCWLYGVGDPSHIRVRSYFGRAPRTNPHGFEFQRIMRFLGADESRCHNYQLPDEIKRLRNTHKWSCGCRTFEVSTCIHNKMLRGQVRICPKCRGRLARV